MPSGKNHLKAELAALGTIALAAAGGNALWAFADWQDQFQPLALIFALAYLFSSLLLSPDLDLAPLRPTQPLGPAGPLLEALCQTLSPPRRLAQSVARPFEPPGLPGALGRGGASRAALSVRSRNGISAPLEGKLARCGAVGTIYWAGIAQRITHSARSDLQRSPLTARLPPTAIPATEKPGPRRICNPGLPPSTIPL